MRIVDMRVAPSRCLSLSAFFFSLYLYSVSVSVTTLSLSVSVCLSVCLSLPQCTAHPADPCSHGQRTSQVHVISSGATFPMITSHVPWLLHSVLEHVVHDRALRAPTNSVVEPSGQGEQEEAPRDAVYVPTGQGRHGIW